MFVTVAAGADAVRGGCATAAATTGEYESVKRRSPWPLYGTDLNWKLRARDHRQMTEEH